jgi:hypothetical protein
MKKKILLSIAAVAVVAIAAVNVNIALQSNDLSALSLANVEALAQEVIIGDPCVYNYSHYCTSWDGSSWLYIINVTRS